MTINIKDLNASLQGLIPIGQAAANQNVITATSPINDIKSILACHACNPSCWSCVFPQLTACSGAVCSFDTTYYRCGSTCTWIVPAGATVAKFEVWGPGAYGGAGLCCGGSPFGATGAYGTVIIPVAEGDTYTMCGGCSQCTIVCCNQASTGQGSPSFITGTGLVNFCAEGGCHNLVRRTCMQRTELCGTNDCCRYQNPQCTTSGPCICNTSYYCYDNSCATCGYIPIFNDTEVSFYGTPFGYNSQHGGTCLDTNNYGFHCHPTVISITDGITAVGDCCFSFSSGNCCGTIYNTCSGYCCHPGLGSFPTHVMGGATSMCGGYGRHGAAKISWC